MPYSGDNRARYPGACASSIVSAPRRAAAAWACPVFLIAAPVAALGWAMTWAALPLAERALAEIRRQR